MEELDAACPPAPDAVDDFLRDNVTSIAHEHKSCSLWKLALEDASRVDIASLEKDVSVLRTGLSGHGIVHRVARRTFMDELWDDVRQVVFCEEAAARSIRRCVSWFLELSTHPSAVSVPVLMDKSETKSYLEAARQDPAAVKNITRVCMLYLEAIGIGAVGGDDTLGFTSPGASGLLTESIDRYRMLLIFACLHLNTGVPVRKVQSGHFWENWPLHALFVLVLRQSMAERLDYMFTADMPSANSTRYGEMYHIPTWNVLFATITWAHRVVERLVEPGGEYLSPSMFLRGAKLHQDNAPKETVVDSLGVICPLCFKLVPSTYRVPREQVAGKSERAWANTICSIAIRCIDGYAGPMRKDKEKWSVVSSAFLYSVRLFVRHCVLSKDCARGRDPGPPDVIASDPLLCSVTTWESVRASK